jgi:uncharacterized protein (DUF2267 family)
MSATGLEVFDRTLQITHIWLNDITEAIGPDKRVAWKVLSVVLHKLRDRLPVELAAHLGAELPLLVRGAYYDQYRPAVQPVVCRHYQDFVAEVQEWLSDTRPVDANEAIRAVFGVLSNHINPAQVDKVREALPKDMRVVWADAEDAYTERMSLAKERKARARDGATAEDAQPAI